MDYPNTGALFRTKEKTNERQPDMYGSVKFDKHYLLSLIEESEGQIIEIKLSGWTKSSATTGTKFLSLKVNTMGQKPAESQDESDDIPF